jgi:hypothetical protein
MLVTLDAKELLAAARLAYDKDQIRSWCKCLLVKVRYDKYTIVGSDGYKLIEFEHKVSHNAADVSEKHNVDFLLYVEDVKKYIKSTDSCVTVDYDSDADNLTARIYQQHKSDNWLRDIVEFDNLSKFGWEYIDYKSIIETQRENDGTMRQGYSAWVNADYMSDICAAVKLAYGKDTPIQIMMGYEGRAMEFMASDYKNERSCFGMVMPVRR